MVGYERVVFMDADMAVVSERGVDELMDVPLEGDEDDVKEREGKGRLFAACCACLCNPCQFEREHSLCLYLNALRGISRICP